MMKIAVIRDAVDITAILRHLGIWGDTPARGLPAGRPAAAAQTDGMV